MELKCIGPDNEEDYITQNRMIEEAVTDGTDVIVFSAIDYEAIKRYRGLHIKKVQLYRTSSS